MTDYTKDREIAEAASKGPWYQDECRYVLIGDGFKDLTTDRYVCSTTRYKGEDNSENNARYIAMAHPARYLELLDTIQDQADTIAAMRCCGNCQWIECALNGEDNPCLMNPGETWGASYCLNWEKAPTGPHAERRSNHA